MMVRIFIFLMVSNFFLIGQDCSQVDITKQFLTSENYDNYRKNFNSFLLSQESTTNKTSSGTDTLNVVFHIFHKGEAYGTGSNITDEQIKSAIVTLNRDFSKQTIHGGIANHQYSVNTGIHFRLACSDPEGNPSNGIVRKNGNPINDFSNGILISQTGNVFEMKDSSNWDESKYINIYVTHLFKKTDGTPTGGGAFGPTNPVFNINAGGIYVTNPNVGHDYEDTINYDLQDSFGRILPHEMGHYLGYSTPLKELLALKQIAKLKEMVFVILSLIPTRFHIMEVVMSMKSAIQESH